MIDLVILTGVLVGGALFGPGKTYIIGAKIAKYKMNSGKDVEVVIEHPSGEKFSVIGAGMFDKDGESCVDFDILLKKDGSEATILTAAELRMLYRVRFIKDCLKAGKPIEERHIRVLCQISDQRRKEIENTPRRRARRI